LRFCVYNGYGDLYFFRDLAPDQHEIKFNIAHPGKYSTNVNCESIKVEPIRIHNLDIVLPPHQKEHYPKDGKFIYRYNPELIGTPARNFYRLGLIELGENFFTQPYPVQEFILDHERGHSFYHDEDLADMYAAKTYISRGFNNSTALHSLTDVLKSPGVQNKERIDKLFKILKR